MAFTPAPGSRQQFFNDLDDCIWVDLTHLKHIKTPKFRSFLLLGNEDCPDEVRLYADADPLVTDTPVMTANLLELDVAA